jgi:plasmid stability protein
MNELMLERTVASEKPKTMSIKMPMDVIEAARIVSAYRGRSMADLMGDILRPALAEMEQEEIEKRIKTKR